MDDPVWDLTVFTKNRERLLAGEIAQESFRQVVTQAQAQGLMSAEHFTVDGTLIEAWAGQKNFRRKESKQIPPTILATRASTSMASGAPTRLIDRPPTHKHDCTRRPAVRRPGSAIWDTC
jgi:hypothetical protein